MENNPGIIGAKFGKSNKMADFCNELDVCTEAETDSVEELDIDESTQRQPALKPNTSTSLLPVPTSASGSSSSASADSAPSFLSRLRSPQPAEICRKRKVAVNPPCGKRRSRGRGNFNPASVTPAQRVKEFPDQPLNVSAGKLFCRACREELSTKLSVLRYHLKSKKHADPTKKRDRMEARERDIAQALVVHDKTHPRGETIPTTQRVYRVKVVTTFLKAGIPLNKIDCFRDLLEEHAYRLTDRRHI